MFFNLNIKVLLTHTKLFLIIVPLTSFSQTQDPPKNVSSHTTLFQNASWDFKDLTTQDKSCWAIPENMHTPPMDDVENPVVNARSCSLTENP